MLLAMEWAQSNRHRGFIAAWPQFGVSVGLFLANLAVLAASAISGGRCRSGTAIAAFIRCCAVVTLSATALMTDYTNRDIAAQ